MTAVTEHSAAKTLNEQLAELDLPARLALVASLGGRTVFTTSLGIEDQVITAEIGLNRLPMHHHPLFRSKVFERVTDDAFFVSIESWDPRFDRSATEQLLGSLGARRVELLES